jgi:hypothetical protein
MQQQVAWIRARMQILSTLGPIDFVSEACAAARRPV